MEKLFHHVLGIRKGKEAAGGNAYGFLPMRFTEAQLEFFRPRPHLFRCYNSAGVCLELMTDSPYIRMAYHVSLKPGTTEQLWFDVLVDDMLVDYQGGSFTDEGAGEWTSMLPCADSGLRKVTVYFPVAASVTVLELELAPGSSAEPTEPRPRSLICFGDSITQGMNASHPSSTYAALLARQLDMSLLNQAVSGFVFHPGLLDPELPYRPDLITVAYGTNDWVLCEDLAEFRDTASAFIGKLAGIYPQTPIAVLSPVWRPDGEERKPMGGFRDIHRILEQLCAEWYHVRLIDGLTLLPHHPDCLTDGLHPNNVGFMHMAMNLAGQLRQIHGGGTG